MIKLYQYLDLFFFFWEGGRFFYMQLFQIAPIITSFLLHGIKENKNQNTDSIALEVINQKFEVLSKESDIARCSRIVRKDQNNAMLRPMIIMVLRYNDRTKAFLSRKTQNTWESQ